MDEEKRLLKRARELDREAFAAIFDRYYDPLYRYIYQHVRHLETAEDLTSDVFHRLVEDIGRGKGPTRHLKAWLFRVAHNLVVDDSRRRRVRRHEPLDERLPSAGPAVARQAHQAVLAQQAEQAMDLLTDKQRSVIALKFLEGHTTPEIARMLGMSERGVLKLQQRGLDALRTSLVHIGALAEEMV